MFTKPKWVEKWPRSFSKVISWRVLITFSNIGGVWLMSGSIESGLKFAGYAVIANSLLYFLHERAWNRVSWAKAENQDDTESRTWKTGITVPEDAKRPRCKVLYSYDGTTGVPDEDDTDVIDWLVVIAYETEEKNGS
jgi:uncharacterized membrane protein